MTNAVHSSGPGLTTTKAPFIEQAVRDGQLFIKQPYELYSDANHDAWRRLYARMLPRWRSFATDAFIRGLDSLCLDPDRIPRLDDVNKYLAAQTGFRAVAVSGYVPAADFFGCLARREFPTTITIRDGATLDYLPEPDIFHDIAGHVPMHADVAFADVLQRLGACVVRATRVVSESSAPDREARAASTERAIARFFWFTIEFGLMRGPNGNGLRAYGSGLLSSYGELEHSLRSPDVERAPFELDRVINQRFEIDHYQPLLFVVDGFDHLNALVATLEQWVEQGRLEDVVPDAADFPLT